MSDTPAMNSGASEARRIRRLMLFVADGEANSLAARKNLQKICDAEPNCHFELQVVNVFDDYQTALKHRVLVTPCLILLEPLPRVMVAGTLNDVDKIRIALRLNTE